tara:strand:+ start:571 stop:1506 length:936 start_codon:yes stop_codon:yes gene_type:complete
MDLFEKIKASRDIKNKSIASYITSLKKIHEKLETSIDFDNLDWLKPINKVVTILNELKLTTRKNYTNAIIVALMTDSDKYKDTLTAYKEYLATILTDYNEMVATQTKSKKETDNWISMADLKKIVAKHKRSIKELGLDQKDSWNKSEKQLYQMYMVGVLYTEYPPLRNDYSNMDIISENDFKKLKKKENNFLVIISRNKKYFSLSSYKTEKQYGDKILEIDSKLNTIINKWLAHNTTGFFLVNSKNTSLSDNSLTKLLNKIFSFSKKKISSTLIRHIYLTEKYSNTQAQMEADASEMGHSVQTQQNIYVKK